MEKGVEIPAVRIIAMVILVFLMLFFVRKAVLPVWSIIEEQLQVKKLTNIEKAVKCAYYRCKYGCEYEDTQEIWFGELNCNLDFCKKIPPKLRKGEKGKVCGWIAKQFPVEVKLEDEDVVSLDILRGCRDARACLMPIETIDGVKESSYPCSIKFENKLLKEIIEGKECEIGYRSWLAECDGKKVDCGASKIRVKSGLYYIWTHKESGPTIVWSKPFYISLNLGVEEEYTFEGGKFYRIKLKYEDEERNAFIKADIAKCPLYENCEDCLNCIDEKLVCDEVYSKCIECLKSENCPKSSECEGCINAAECDVENGFGSCFYNWTSPECQEYFVYYTDCNVSCENCFKYDPYINLTLKYYDEGWRTTSNILEEGNMTDVMIDDYYYLHVMSQEIDKDTVKLKIGYFYFPPE